MEYSRLEIEAGDEHFLVGSVLSAGRLIRVEQVGTIPGTDFIYVSGGDQNDQDCKVIQHYSQLSILFTFVPLAEVEPEKRNPIGFLR
jgi:hypothetical protein